MNLDRSRCLAGALALVMLAPLDFAAVANATATQDDGRALPYSRGRQFATLDAYLRHLRSNGAIDLPYYRPIKPGVYELVTSFRPVPSRDRTKRLYTRRELMRMYGFTR